LCDTTRSLAAASFHQKIEDAFDILYLDQNPDTRNRLWRDPGAHKARSSGSHLMAACLDRCRTYGLNWPEVITVIIFV
jgi:hypothetical protein